MPRWFTCQQTVTHPHTKRPDVEQRSRIYLLYKPSYSQFCPKFSCHGNTCYPFIENECNGEIEQDVTKAVT